MFEKKRRKYVSKLKETKYNSMWLKMSKNATETWATAEVRKAQNIINKTKCMYQTSTATAMKQSLETPDMIIRAKRNCSVMILLWAEENGVVRLKWHNNDILWNYLQRIFDYFYFSTSHNVHN